MAEANPVPKRRSTKPVAPANADTAGTRSVATRRTKSGKDKPRRSFEDICDSIRNDVASGHLLPGDRLPPERDLAQRFDVSRSAVREALRSMEVAGFVHCQQGQGGGAFIKQSDSAVVTQAVRDMVLLGQIPAYSVTEARIGVAALAIRLACERGSGADFAAIERDIDQLEQLTRDGEFSRRRDHITEFYRLLARATHNPVIVMMLDALSELVRTLMQAIADAPLTDVVAVRRRVLAHLRARNAESAIAEITDHLERLDREIRNTKVRPQLRLTRPKM
ncbi:MAG: FadR/GntR family transcriptional regulator [Janthinobacterium lividum]